MKPLFFKSIFNIVLIVAFFTVMASVFPAKTYAQNSSATIIGDFQELKHTGVGRVLSVIDPLSLQLDDGRIISLSGLYYPDWRTQQEAGTFSSLAIEILEDMLTGQQINIYQTKKKKDWGRMNRMGHHLAHIELKDNKIWVQGMILSLGLVQVYTNERTPEMAAQMYSIERKAREDNDGLWEEEQFQILTPEDTPQHLNSLRLVEGKIVSTALKNNRLYLNFGKNWRDDFTVSVAPEHKRTFFKQKKNPLSWNNRTVRVRGWIGSLNGPYIEITHPQAIEFIDSPPHNSIPRVTEKLDSES